MERWIVDMSFAFDINTKLHSNQLDTTDYKSRLTTNLLSIVQVRSQKGKTFLIRTRQPFRLTS